MDEEVVRELLSRYRVVGPDAGLRSRVLFPVTETLRAWPWTAAAAALVAATVGFHVATDHAVERGRPPAGDSAAALAAALGGGDEAVEAARAIVLEQTFRTWLTGSDDTHETVEDLLNGNN